MKTITKSTIFALLTLTLIGGTSTDSLSAADQIDEMISKPSLTISDAWSPQAPPGRMMAGFMTLHNDSEVDVSLISGESQRFGRVEIHSMRMDEGVMRMRKLEQLDIPAGESVVLRPGSLHLMLMQPEGGFAPGDRFDLDLIDDQGQRLTVTLEVRQRRASP